MLPDVAPACKSPPCPGTEPGSRAARSEREESLSFEEVLEKKKKARPANEQPDAAAAAVPVAAPPPPQVPPSEPAASGAGETETAAAPGIAAPGMVAPGMPAPGTAADAAAGAADGSGEALAALVGEVAGSGSLAVNLQAASASLLASVSDGVEQPPAQPAVDALLAAAHNAAAESVTGESADIQKAGAQGAAIPFETAGAAASYQQPAAEMVAGAKNEPGMAEFVAEPAEQVVEMVPERAKEAYQPKAPDVDPSIQAQAAGAPQAHRLEPSIAAQEPARTAEASQELLHQVTRNIQLATTQNGTTMRVHLHPHELGSIDIRLVNNQNGVGIMVLAEKAATSRLLESQMAQLQQAVMNTGVQVSQLWVGQNPQYDAQTSLLSQQRGDQQPTGGREQNFTGSQKGAPQSGQTRKAVRYSMIDYRA